MWGARKKSGWGVSWTTLELSASTRTSGRQGRGGMAQNGGIRGETFHGEMDHCRESQGWTTACCGMPERNGKGQGEDSPKRTDSCWFACLSLLTSHKWRELVSSGRLVCRCHEVFLWCYVYLVLLRFCLYAFVEAAALRSIVLRCAGAPIATRVYFSLSFFPFVYLEMSLFPSIFCTIAAFSLNGEYVVRSFLPNGVLNRRYFQHAHFIPLVGLGKRGDK